MALEEESQNLTAFKKPLGLYKWKRLPMGLASAPGVFQNLQEFFCWPLLLDFLLYLDEQHLKKS